MEGGGPEIENMVFSNNLNESTNKEVERKQEQKKESEAGEAEKGSGVISNFISAVVSSRGKDDQEVEVDEEATKSDASEEENKEEKEGGLLNHLISMVTPNQHSNNTESEDGENGLNSEVESDKSLIVEDRDGGGGVIQNLISNILNQKNGENNKIGEDEKVSEDEGGRDIVENGESHLPVNDEDKFGTAPAIEEASILIHSIVHD